MNITVNLDRGEKRTAWEVARAILEGFEPGASKHCLEHELCSGGAEGWNHHRLNIRITVWGGGPQLERRRHDYLSERCGL